MPDDAAMECKGLLVEFRERASVLVLEVPEDTCSDPANAPKGVAAIQPLRPRVLVAPADWAEEMMSSRTTSSKYAPVSNPRMRRWYAVVRVGYLLKVTTTDPKPNGHPFMMPKSHAWPTGDQMATTAASCWSGRMGTPRKASGKSSVPTQRLLSQLDEIEQVLARCVIHEKVKACLRLDSSAQAHDVG